MNKYRTQFLFAILIVLFLFGSVQADDSNVFKYTISIVDITNKPISGVTVSIDGHPGYTGVTDDNGEIVWYYPYGNNGEVPKSVTLIGTKTGYLSFHETVFVLNMGPPTGYLSFFKMTPDRANLYQSSTPTATLTPRSTPVPTTLPITATISSSGIPPQGTGLSVWGLNESDTITLLLTVGVLGLLLLIIAGYIIYQRRIKWIKNGDISKKITELEQNATTLIFFGTQLESIITQVKNQYTSGAYDTARITLGTAEQVTADLKHKEDCIAQWRSKGYDTAPLELLKSENITTINLAFCNFEQHLESQRNLAGVKETGRQILAKMGEFGQIPDDLRSTVESRFQAREISVVENAIASLENFRRTAKPDLEIGLDTTTFTVGVWVLTRVTLKNTGLAHAIDVMLSFSEEFQTKGIKPITIQAGTSTQIEFTLMPKNAGKILLDAILTFKDVDGREYRKMQEFWIEVVASMDGFTASNQSGTRGSSQRSTIVTTDNIQPSVSESAEYPAHHDVFISYSSKDKLVADAICNHLESQKIRCWIAPRDAVPGLHYQGSIMDAIDASSIMVLVFSSYSNKSPHVLTELNEAMSNNIIIIPFRIEDILPSQDMKYVIASSHWLDAITPPIEKHIDTLVKTVTVLINKRE